MLTDGSSTSAPQGSLRFLFLLDTPVHLFLAISPINPNDDVSRERSTNATALWLISALSDLLNALSCTC
jgi:hypothetical protein